MADPKRYERGYSFAGFQANAPKTPLPGQKVDVELANIETAMNETQTALSDIRRSDGKLNNGIVTASALSAEVSAGVQPAVAWLTATSYGIGATVFYGTGFYRCLVAHVSGVFADDFDADLWDLFADLGPIVVDAEAARDEAEAAAVTATGAASTASTSATTATTQAGIATGAASTASTSATTATTQAGLAAGSAGTAATQAGIATTQAGIATTQAGVATAAAASMATVALTDGTDLNTLVTLQRVTVLAPANPPVAGGGLRWMVEVVVDPSDADGVSQRAVLLDGGASIQLWMRRRTLAGAWEAWVEVGAGATVAPSPPQGRLTLSSGVSVMSSAVAAATTVYYTPHVGRFVPLYDGSSKFVMTDIAAELSQALSDTTKSPAAAANNSNYDMFVWLDGATQRCTRGPAWTSDTNPGTGAGTTEIEMVNGIWVNKFAITNGPAAQRGTYVGSIRTNGSAVIDWSRGSAAAGGGIANMTVWNAYNQTEQQINIRDTTAAWVYNVGVYRALNNSATNRVNLLAGRGNGPVDATAQCRINSVGGFAGIGFGIDSTTALAPGATRGLVVGYDGPASSVFRGAVGAGYHYLSAIETGGGGTQTFLAAGTDQAIVATWAC